MLRPILLTGFVSLALTLPRAAAQHTVFLAPDGDNTLYAENFASNGSGSRMFSGYRASGEPRRAVMHFDVASVVPAGALITNAQLRVSMLRTRAGTTTHTLHKLLADWGEGPSFGTGGGGGGANPAPNDCTWTERYLGGALWTTPGGDFVPTASASRSIGTSLTTYTFASTAALVADVQSWLDAPAANFGWIMIGNETPGLGRTAKAFGTREDPPNAPRLSITFTIAATATSFGADCGGAVPLALAPNGLPTIGNNGFALLLSGGASPQTATACLFGRAVSQQPFPLFGCNIWIDVATLFASVPFNGSGTLALSIANDPVLLGQRFATQGAAIVGGAQLDTSNGVLLRIGK